MAIGLLVDRYVKKDSAHLQRQEEEGALRH